MEVELIIIRKSQMVEEIILLDKIQKYQIKKQKVQKELETNNGQAWEDDRIVYIEERIYILNNRKI